MGDVTVYGYGDACSEFKQRHPDWDCVFKRLKDCLDMAFARNQAMNEDIDAFVYFYGNLVLEDFMEVFILAANGLGFGAMKLLRSMYEHAVTLKYLHDHPDELQAFFDFDHVQQHKLMQQILDTFGADALPAETVADVKQKYAQVKEQFMVRSCKSNTCQEKRVNHTWNKLDFAAMAKQTGAIGTLIVPGYFMPLKHAHSTFRAMQERLEENADHVGFSRGSQPDEADSALSLAHNCLLSCLEVQDQRFKVPGLKVAIEGCVRDWALVWSPEALAKLDAESAGTT